VAVGERTAAATGAGRRPHALDEREHVIVATDIGVVLEAIKRLSTTEESEAMQTDAA